MLQELLGKLAAELAKETPDNKPELETKTVSKNPCLCRMADVHRKDFTQKPFGSAEELKADRLDHFGKIVSIAMSRCGGVDYSRLNRAIAGYFKGEVDGVGTVDLDFTRYYWHFNVEDPDTGCTHHEVWACNGTEVLKARIDVTQFHRGSMTEEEWDKIGRDAADAEA